jgi:hypothetical protein
MRGARPGTTGCCSGVPLAVKDVHDFAGEVTAYGTVAHGPRRATAPSSSGACTVPGDRRRARPHAVRSLRGARDDAARTLPARHQLERRTPAR